MGFVANFTGFQQCKKFENRLRESLKVTTFLRYSVVKSTASSEGAPSSELHYSGG